MEGDILCTVHQSSPLGVCEVRWDGDDHVIDLDSKSSLRNVLELGEECCRQLLGGQLHGLSGVVNVVAGRAVLGADNIIGDTRQLRHNLRIINFPKD